MSTLFISTINTKITEDYLRSKRENQYFERKGVGERDTKPTKIAEELIGMLNADGGVLAFGVADDGTFQNLATELTPDKLDDYRTLCFDFIDPACNIELEEVSVNGNLIFLYHVELDHERLFKRKDNEQVFLRVLDTNRKLNLDGIKKLEYDKAIRKFEDEVEASFEVEDLDIEMLENYRERLNYKGELIDLMVKRYLAKKKGTEYFIKHSGILLFSQDPEKYIPSASVRYVRYEGREALTGTDHNVVKDERFENNIPNLIDELKVFLKASFKDYHFLDLNEGKFKKVPEYPEEAWLEGIVNALCHRSYSSQGNSIYIKHFDDRLEISNSGPLPAQVTIQNIKTERYARNPRVARVLEDMGYVRQLNEGVSRIYESMEKSMLSVPEYREANGNVYLTLRNKISEHSKTIDDKVMKKMENNWSNYNDTQIRIFNYLFLEHTGTIDDLVRYTDINENTVRSYLNGFIEEGILIKNSIKKRDRNAKYCFKKD